jgi:hypothetical protein
MLVCIIPRLGPSSQEDRVLSEYGKFSAFQAWYLYLTRKGRQCCFTTTTKNW